MSLIVKKSPPLLTIWKVAVYGAGTNNANGEYIWDGITLIEGKPQYFGPTASGAPSANYIYWEGETWRLFGYDPINEAMDNLYQGTATLQGSFPFTIEGVNPVPSSVLSYAQDSFISSITLVEAGVISSNGTYISDGTIVNGSPQFTGPNGNTLTNDGGGSVVLHDTTINNDPYYCAYPDYFLWFEGSSGLPYPKVSAIVYSA